MSTAPSPEIWNDILKDNVEKDDPLWTEYLDKAAVFDVRMVDEWNKIVDVLLVYDALFIAILTAFINSSSFPLFQRNPADVTNDLLVVIYNQLAAQSNNASIPPVNTTSLSNQNLSDHNTAVTENALLYVSLTLSIIVSVIALAAKLWLVSYSQQAFSVGSPYDRAMKRQEAYNGVLVWKMGAVINMLPVILLIALYLFGLYVFSSIRAVQEDIGNTVGALFCIGMTFLGFTGLCAAIFPGCPFRSALSDVIRFVGVEALQKISNRFPRRRPLHILSVAGLLILSYGISITLITVYNLLQTRDIPSIVPLIFLTILPVTSIIPLAIPALLGQQLLEADRKPQKYRIPYMAAFAFYNISLYVIVMLLTPLPYVAAIPQIIIIGLVYRMFGFMSKSMADTGEIDAIAWLLITTPQYPATFFKKAAQMTGVGSIGRDYRPRLLESLMPLLSSLITLYRTPEHDNSDTHSPESDDVLNGRRRTNPRGSDMVPIDEDPHLKDLEVYTACLARLTDFTDYKGKYFRLWEDAKRHPKLEQPLIDKLVELANPRQSLVGLRSAAIKVLKNYNLDMEGNLNPLKNILGSTLLGVALGGVATVPKDAATSIMMLNDKWLKKIQVQEHPDPATHVEPPSEATPMLNDNGSNSQEQGHPDPATHIEPPNGATPMLNDIGLNSQEQGHSELYRPVEDGQWTTFERRRARSPDSPGRVPKNSMDSKNPNRLLTTDQAQTVEAAASNLTEHQKNSISRRQKKISAYRESSLPSIGEGPSKSKGKNIDPHEWGQVNISLESLDIEAQETALNSIAPVKKMTTHRKDEYYELEVEERNPPATRRRSRQASLPAESHPAAQIAKDSDLVSALNKDPSTRIDPPTHVEPPSAASSNESGLNDRERRHSELYRPEDPGTRVESEECEIGDEKIEEVNSSQIGDEESEEVKRD